MPRRIGDHRFQLFVLVALDKTFSRYHVRSATEKDAARLTIAGDELGDLVWDISYCLVHAS